MTKDKISLAIMEDRKLILGMLNMRYPNFVPGESIYRIIIGISTDYTKRRLIRDLSYFNEKGYVAFRGLHGIEAMTISVKDCAFALTAQGLEIAQKLVTDPALDI